MTTKKKKYFSLMTLTEEKKGFPGKVVETHDLTQCKKLLSPRLDNFHCMAAMSSEERLNHLETCAIDFLIIAHMS